MRRLSFPSVTIIVAALAATPVVAQAAEPVSSLPTATPTSKQKFIHKHRHVSRTQDRHYAARIRHDARAGYTSTDNIADRLNRAELEKLSGTTMPPTATARSSAASANLMAPGTLSGAYGQPSPTEGIPGGNQPSASSVSTLSPATYSASATAAGLMAPGTLGGSYGQPSPTQGIPGGSQPSASSASTVAPAASSASAPNSGLLAPGTLGGSYGQPSPTQGIPGGNQPSASSRSPY